MYKFINFVTWYTFCPSKGDLTSAVVRKYVLGKLKESTLMQELPVTYQYSINRFFERFSHYFWNQILHIVLLKPHNNILCFSLNRSVNEITISNKLLCSFHCTFNFNTIRFVSEKIAPRATTGTTQRKI